MPVQEKYQNLQLSPQPKYILHLLKLLGLASQKNLTILFHKNKVRWLADHSLVIQVYDYGYRLTIVCILHDPLADHSEIMSEILHDYNGAIQ